MMRVSNDGGAREEIRSRGVPRLVSAPVLLVLAVFSSQDFQVKSIHVYVDTIRTYVYPLRVPKHYVQRP